MPVWYGEEEVGGVVAQATECGREVRDPVADLCELELGDERGEGLRREDGGMLSMDGVCILTIKVELADVGWADQLAVGSGRDGGVVVMGKCRWLVGATA